MFGFRYSFSAKRPSLGSAIRNSQQTEFACEFIFVTNRHWTSLTNRTVSGRTDGWRSGLWIPELYLFLLSSAGVSGRRSGTIGAGRRGWIFRGPEGGGESRCVTTTSPEGFSGKLDVDGAGSSSSCLSLRVFSSSGIVVTIFLL